MKYMVYPGERGEAGRFSNSVTAVAAGQAGRGELHGKHQSG